MAGVRFFFLIIIVFAFTAFEQALAQDVTALKGGTMIDSSLDAPVEDAVIIIRNGRIEAAGTARSTPIPDSANIIDVSGHYVTPGLIDAHMHFSQSGSLYTRPDGLDLRDVRPYEEDRAHSNEQLPVTLRRYLASGVTSVVDVGGPISNLSIKDKAGDITPRIALAGPLLATLTPDFAQRVARLDLGGDPTIIPVTSARKARKLVRDQLAANVDLVKIWYIASDARPAEKSYKTVAAIIDEAHKGGVRVAVHATQLETARLAVQAGTDILVHTVDDAPVDTAFIEALKASDVIVTSTAVVYEHIGQLRSREVELLEIEKRLGDPVIISSWEEAPPESKSLRTAEAINARVDLILKNLKTLADAGVRVAVGTDAGNPGTLHGPSIHRELALLERGGFTPEQILQAATMDAASVFSTDANFGTIRPGNRADLLILRSNPLEEVSAWQDIKTVMVGGVRHDAARLAPLSPAAVVQRQLDAYNAHNIEGFIATYSDEIELFTLPSTDARSGGHAMLRDVYGSLFKEQKPNCRALSRTIEGTYVIDQEFCRFGERVIRATAIYQVEDGLIRRVWFAR